MLKAVLLRLHRWISVIFAIPLAVLIVTGLVLSFMPIVETTGFTRGAVTQAQIEAALTKYDPQGKARALSIDSAAGTMSLRGEERVTVNLKTGEKAEGRNALTSFFFANRMLHEHLVYDLDWLVPLSTAAMLISMIFGVLMGWPRITNSLSGWHKAVAWTLLPLLILSPLTGLMLTYRISLSPPVPRAQPVPVADVIRMVAQKHDVSGIVSIRRRGPRQMVVINDGTGRTVYMPTKDGLRELPANLPRMFHEGHFFGIWGGVMNAVLSLAFAFLLGSGMWIWAKRTFFRKRNRNRVRHTAPEAAAPAQ